MDKKSLKLRKSQDIYQVGKHHNKTILIGSLIATFIALTPYLFYLHESVPVTPIWETFLFKYDSNSWGDANFAMWVLTGKVIPLFLILIWFFTSRHWWYHALLVPIAMYIYQTFQIFNENITYIDEFQLIHLVPIMAIVIPSIYLIRAQMFNKVNTVNKSLEELEEEFKIKPKGLFGKIKQYF